MAQVKVKAFNRKEVKAISESVRDGFQRVGTEKNILSLKSNKQRVLEAAARSDLKIVRKLNQHIARYAIQDGKHEMTFKANIVR